MKQLKHYAFQPIHSFHLQQNASTLGLLIRVRPLLSSFLQAAAMLNTSQLHLLYINFKVQLFILLRNCNHEGFSRLFLDCCHQTAFLGRLLSIQQVKVKQLQHFFQILAVQLLWRFGILIQFFKTLAFALFIFHSLILFLVI